VVVLSEHPDGGGTWEWDRGARRFRFFKRPFRKAWPLPGPIAYDPSSRQVVTLGQVPGASRSRLHAWTGSDWTPVDGGEPSRGSPYGLLAPAPAREALIVVGVEDNGWTLSVQEWSARTGWRSRGAKEIPRGEFFSNPSWAIGYDPSADKVLVQRGWYGLRDTKLESALFEWDLSAGALERVTQGPAGRERPSLSSNGRYVAFSSEQSGRSNIWIRELATGKEAISPGQQTASRYLGEMPLFSPDGQWIAAIGGGVLTWRLSVVQPEALRRSDRLTWRTSLPAASFAIS
jgi:hypothetical protein